MKEATLKLVQKDIDEALSTIENMEEDLNFKKLPKESIKNKFIFLSQKVSELERILIEEGILK